MKNKKVGIITWHYYFNFGSALQAFALQKLILDLGYDVQIINYRKQLLQQSYWKSFIKLLLHYSIGLFSRRFFDKTSKVNAQVFQDTYLRQTKQFDVPEELEQVAKEYGCLVYGSDQIWAPNVYKSIYMGAYVPSGVRKISYAASIGLNDIPADLVPAYIQNLSSYSSISVREEEGHRLLKDKCGIHSTVVLDPTLMIDANTYYGMQKPVKGISGKFLYCYFLNKEHKYRDIVVEYAQRHGLQIIGSSENDKDSEWMQRLSNIGADQFLWLINNSEAVFTDSYHGSIFSLLFHNKLWIFVRFNEDNPICQNSRIRQLQNYFEIEHRIISQNKKIDESIEIDYDDFESKLSELRKSSLAYLKTSLEKEC